MESDSRILIYSHHSRGIGHYVRTRQIIEALKGQKVFFINGGEEIPGLPQPSHVTLLNLPPIRFSRSSDPIPQMDLEIAEKRVQLVASFVNEIQPDVFVIEFFPFGRWYLRGELLPILNHIKIQKQSKPKVICSLRDIPKDIHSKAYMTRCCAILNTYFDHLLIHSDSSFCPISETFPSWKHIKINTVYTGYISQQEDWKAFESSLCPESIPLKPQEKLVLITAGSGTDHYNTYDFLSVCIQAKDLLDRHIYSKFVIFTGHCLSDKNFDSLRNLFCQKDIILERFTTNILKWMGQADVSISRGGYNTCMNILETRVKSVIVPALAAGDQSTRADRLKELNLAIKVDEYQLTPHKLCNSILEALEREKGDHNIRLDGAQNTARFLSNLLHNQ